MRWLVAPLVAAAIFAGSGFLSAIQETTEASLQLAKAGKEAPKTTEEAAEEVGTLPEIAGLTRQQADAFKALADALQVSAERVFALNDSLDEQATDVAGLRDSLDALVPPINCAKTRLAALLEAADGVPGRLSSIVGTLGELMESQERSIRHLRSINRKLTAFGVVAEASGVKVPPPPDAPPLELPDSGTLSHGRCGP